MSNSSRYLVVRNESSASVYPESSRGMDIREIVATIFPRLKPRTRRSETAEIVLWRKTNKVFRQPSELLMSIVRDSRSMGSLGRAETPNHELAGWSKPFVRWVLGLICPVAQFFFDAPWNFSRGICRL